MFGNRKKLNELNNKIQELELQKQELLIIQEILEEKSPKMDISNVYVFSFRGIHYFVELNVKEFIGNTLVAKNVNLYHSTLTDIFNGYIVYEKNSRDLINETETIYSENYFYNEQKAKFIPIFEAEPNLLAYTDRMVPLYVLQQLFYKLNKIDLSDSILKKRTTN